MADAKLEKMRQMIREEEEKKSGNRSSSGGDRASYPYWNIPEKQTATVRFLPDQDDNNAWFWVERQTIKLPFDGVEGGDRPTTSPVMVTVPCVDMFGDTCPVIAASRPWWKTDEALARKYWKKRSFIAQGFVVSSPFEESDAPENPIRKLILGPSLLEKVKAGLIDPEMENTPIDYLNGTDFKIKKTRKGDYNNYDTSEWSRKSRPLSEAEQIAIAQHGLFNLKDAKGTRPDADGVAMIKAMFQDSIDGKPFDMAAYGAHYKPYSGFGSGSAPDVVEDFMSPVKYTTASNFREDPKPDSDEAPLDTLAALRAKTATIRRP